MNPERMAKTGVVLSSQLVTDGATVTANIDTKGADYATITVNCSVEEGTDANNPTLSILTGDTTAVSDFATIVANQSLDLSAARIVTYGVDLRGKKRYLRLSFTAGTGTGNDVTVGATYRLLRLDKAPASTSDMRASTNDVVVLI